MALYLGLGRHWGVCVGHYEPKSSVCTKLISLASQKHCDSSSSGFGVI